MNESSPLRPVIEIDHWSGKREVEIDRKIAMIEDESAMDANAIDLYSVCEQAHKLTSAAPRHIDPLYGCRANRVHGFLMSPGDMRGFRRKWRSCADRNDGVDCDWEARQYENKIL